MKKFEIKKISFGVEDFEQLGTKEKFWFIYLSEGFSTCLFKYSRDNTGEHWSEKVAEQLCEILHIPHVKYDIALSHGRLGVVTKNIVPDDHRMVMGNEVLHNHEPNTYPIPENENNTFVRVREHTVSRVIGTLDKGEVAPPASDFDIGNLNAGDVFCGYLMLDVLISNQDRHHENWAILIDNKTNIRTLCPTYDHAASLGRELRDEERKERLTTKDEYRQLSTFVRKARSELFKLKTDRKPLTTIEAFFLAVKGRNNAKEHWLNKLKLIDEATIKELFSMLPKEVISPLAKEFAIKMIIENRNRLLNYES